MLAVLTDSADDAVHSLPVAATRAPCADVYRRLIPTQRGLDDKPDLQQCVLRGRIDLRTNGPPANRSADPSHMQRYGFSIFSPLVSRSPCWQRFVSRTMLFLQMRTKTEIKTYADDGKN